MTIMKKMKKTMKNMTMLNGTIKIGDTVIWRGGWGMDLPAKAKVTAIEICTDGDKYGTSVEEIKCELLANAVMNLDNGSWCYGWQIDGKV